jgi:hypothetical protein
VVVARVRLARLVGGFLLVSLGATVATLDPSWWSVAMAAAFLIDFAYESTRRARFNGAVLAFRAFHLRWREIPVTEIYLIQATRSANGFTRQLAFYKKRLGFVFTPLWWAGADRLIVAVVDRCLEINPNVRVNRGAQREIRNARRRLGGLDAPANPW